MALLTDVGGGATAMPPVAGAWMNKHTRRLIREEPVIVYSYIRAKQFEENLPRLVDFVKRLGRETGNQGAVAIEFAGDFLLIEDFGE